MAIGGLHYAQKIGLSVPNDIGIAGWGDLPISAIQPYRLTSIAVPHLKDWTDRSRDGSGPNQWRAHEVHQGRWISAYSWEYGRKNLTEWVSSEYLAKRRKKRNPTFPAITTVRTSHSLQAQSCVVFKGRQGGLSHHLLIGWFVGIRRSRGDRRILLECSKVFL